MEKFSLQPQKHRPGCKFTTSSTIIDSMFPSTMKFSKLRRQFRECLLVSEKNGRKCHGCQGAAGYIFEKEKQITQHYHMIHPYSSFRQYWELTIVVEIIISLTARFFTISQFALEAPTSAVYQVFALFLDLFDTSDVLLNFLTGYVDKETRTVILETEKVFYHTIKQPSFYISILGSLPFEFIFYLSWTSNDPNFMYIVFLKILQLRTVSRYLCHIAHIYNWSDLCYRIVWSSITMYLLAHWITCLYYLVFFGLGHEDDFQTKNGPFYRHFTIFYMTTSIFFFQNGLLSHIHMYSLKRVLLSSVVLIIIYLFNVAFIGFFVQLLGLLKTPLVQYEERLQEVQKFLHQENLPSHIHVRALEYYRFRFRNKYFNEKKILEMLSPPLKQEIADFLCTDFIRHPDSIFNGIPDSLASALCLQMKSVIFLAGDVIIRAKTKGSKMYFISCGSVVLYSSQGKELKHLHNNEQFGALSFANDNRYVITAIALEMSECYFLRYSDFLYSTQDYPEYRQMIIETVATRKENFGKTKPS